MKQNKKNTYSISRKFLLCCAGFVSAFFLLEAIGAYAFQKTFLLPNEFFRPKKAIFTKTYENIDATWTRVPNQNCQYTDVSPATVIYDNVPISKDGNYQAWADIYNYSDVDIAPLGEKFDLRLSYNPGTGVVNKDVSVGALLIKQRVYFDVGYVLKGQVKFTLSFNGSPAAFGANKQLALCEFGLSESGKVSDVIGVKVFGNPLHLSADAWYKSGICRGQDGDNVNNVCFSNTDCQGFKCVDTADADTNPDACNNPDATACAQNSECQTTCEYNVANRGSASAVTIDGFSGVRSGRTVYVNAANLDTTANVLYTNMYLLSYNENASEETTVIFNSILKNWKFMDNIIDPDEKDKFRRDTVRFADIRNMQIQIRDFYRKNGYYPLWDNVRKTFSGGTYVPGVTLSVWPSWKNNFAKQISTQLPIDPINVLQTCPDPCCAAGTCGAAVKVCNADPKTCWDEKSLRLACPAPPPTPPDFKTYVYQNLSAGNYKLGVEFEYKKPIGALWYDWNDLVNPLVPKNAPNPPEDPSGQLNVSSNIIPQVCVGISANDLDNDTVLDQTDNCKPSDCPNRFDCANPGQADGDADGLGDVCDPCPNSSDNDKDHDGLCALGDNCPLKFNPDQKDSDSDGIGDACDITCQKDSDNDTTCDELDNCPYVFNPAQENSDGGPFGCCPPNTPRFCQNTLNRGDVLPGGFTYRPGTVCATDQQCFVDGGGAFADPFGGGLYDYCKTPDILTGQVWPNGQEFGDACDPLTDSDNDGFSTGFCGGYSTGDWVQNNVNFRVCNVDADCAGFVFPPGVATGFAPDKCVRLSASQGTKMDNCTTANFYSANPGQEDYDKDLIGYTCDQCIDTDKDTHTDVIMNEGFEGGLGKWKLVTNLKNQAILDGSRVGVHSNYAHLDDPAWEARTGADKAYRGIYSAWVESISTDSKWFIYTTRLSGPLNILTTADFDNRAQYKIKVKVKSDTDNPITMIVRRACHNTVASIAAMPVPYIASCKGSASENIYTTVVSPANSNWNTLEANFYIDYSRSQDEVAIIFAVDEADGFYIDDVQMYWRLSEAFGGVDSCAGDKPDNCNTFSNDTQIDKDEDNIGDACDLCTDSDVDGWGDPSYNIQGCPKSFKASDNCPITPNADQKDYDDDSKLCVYNTLTLPYVTQSTGACLSANNSTNFDPKKCDFCGGDACDLDADGDKCYNWAQVKDNPANAQFSIAGPDDVVGTLINREEDYLKTGFHYEDPWLKSSSDTDHDSLPDDCDAQVCGDAQVATGNKTINSSPIVSLASLKSIHIYEATGSVNDNVFNLPADKAKLTTNAPAPALVGGVFPPASCDLLGTNTECYDIYTSDENGAVDPVGAYLAIELYRPAALTTPGGNIDAVSLDYGGGNIVYANTVASVVYGGNCPAGYTCANTAPYALGPSDGTWTWLGNGMGTGPGDPYALLVLSFPSGGSSMCTDASIGLQQCEECDKNNFGLSSICDDPNPLPGSSGTLRDMYPFNTQNSNAMFIAHFDDDTLQAIGRATPISPSTKANVALDTGLFGIAAFKKSAVITSASQLTYPSSSYNSAEGTINVWVRPNKSVAKLEIAKDPVTGIPQKVYTVNWNANEWHMITATYGLFFAGPPSVYIYTFYLDGVFQDGAAYLPPISGDIDIKYWLWFLGLQVDVPGNFMDVALDEMVIFSNRIQDDAVVKAMYDAVINRCTESQSQSVTKYMVDNYCAVCNNLQCQIKALRMCQQVSVGNMTIPKVSPTYYLWVANSYIHTVTQIAALPVDTYSSGDKIHEYKICKVGGGAGGGGSCVNDPANCPSGYCAVDYKNDGKDPTIFPKLTTCQNIGCTPVAYDPTRVAANVEDNTAWVAYRNLSGGVGSGVGYFDAYKGLIKFCPMPNQLMRGMIIDKNGNGWAGSTNQTIYKIDKSPSGCPDPSDPMSPMVTGIAVYGMAIDSHDNAWISANEGDDRVYRLDNIGGMVDHVALNQGLCNGTIETGTTVGKKWKCRWYNTSSIYGIAVDDRDWAWVGRQTDPEDSVYVIDPSKNGAGQVLTQVGPGGLRMGVALQDTGSALEVRMLATRYPAYNVFHMYDYDSAGNVTNAGDSIDFTLLGIGKVAVATGDSEGNTWVIGENTGNVFKLNFDADALLGTFSTSWLGTSGHYMYSDFTGINRAMVFRTGVATYPPGVGGLSSFDTEFVSWSGRWGRIMYDREKYDADTNDIRVFVYLTDNPSTLSYIPNDAWILADPYDSSRDQYNKKVGQTDEYKGKYMKIRVMLSTKTKDAGFDPKISNLRITCRDNNGNNICQ